MFKNLFKKKETKNLVIDGKSAKELDDDAFDCFQNGDYYNAIKLWELSANMYIKTDGENCPYVATGYNSIGLAYEELGESKKALDSFLKADKIFKKIYDNLNPETIGNNYRIAENYDILGDFDNSLLYFLKVLKSRIEEFGKEHKITEKVMTRMEEVYNKLGKTEPFLEWIVKNVSSN